MALVVTVKSGESIYLWPQEGRMEIKAVYEEGRIILVIEAPRSIKILREKLVRSET